MRDTHTRRPIAPPAAPAPSCGLAGAGTRRAWAGQLGLLGAAAIGWYAVGSAASMAWALQAKGASSSPVGNTADSSKLEKRRVTIAVSNKTALAYLPLTVAEQLGYFQAEGLELEVLEPPSMVRAQQMASSGGVDIISGWMENTLSAQTKGQAFQAFVLQGRAPQIALGVSTKSLPGFKSVADLRGKKVGIMAPGTPSHTVAHAALAKAGLRLGDMAFVSVGTASGALAALRAGQVDALCYGDPIITQLEQSGELRVVADTRNLRGTREVCGGDMPSTCLYAPPEFLQKHPYTTQAVANAMVHALKWLQTAGLSDMMKTVPEGYFAGDRALYLSAFARMREAIALDGLIPPAGVRNTLDAMRSADPTLRMQTMDPLLSYTNVFAQRAKQRFRV
jgi:NitT/TauT family transport system substrate-binding protein